MTKPKVLCFSGSIRKGSFNQKLLNNAIELLEKVDFLEIVHLDLAKYSLPIYNQDLLNEKGYPPKAIKLKKNFSEAQAFVIASPEYNGLITPLLKNTFDWISRPDDLNLRYFTNKLALIFSASTGSLGGLRGLNHLRALLNNLGIIVLPEQLAVPFADKSFDSKGILALNKIQKLDQLITGFTQKIVKCVS